MANSYFQFKQFTVHQQQDMMKVCTDSCLFGAWAAHHLAGSSVHEILDIGAGTGLLALMLAQKCNAKITAVEIEDVAFQQAKENIENSRFTKAISLKHADIQEFTEGRFDFVLTNPPFYEKDLRSDRHAINLARHNAGLTFDGLLAVINRLLLPNGEFAVLLPASRKNEFVKTAKSHSLFPQRETMVRHSCAHGFFRAMCWFGRKTSQNVAKEEISIRDNNGNYTPVFTYLLQDYYLNL